MIFKPSKPFCVIKQFLPDLQGTETVAKAAELFAQEAERLEVLVKHPQIPELFAYFSVDSRQYLVQEFIKGETLEKELDNHGVFNESQIRELLIDLLSVLQFVHSHNVIHRDIKPENIIRREADKRLVLVDFGASKIMPKTQRRTVTGTVIGSAEYCAPKQSMGKAKSGSDMYSLGVVCLHLLTGMNPFDLYDVMEMEWVWRDCLNGNFVSDELGKVLDSLVEQKPKQGYQKVEDVLADLGFDSSSISTTQENQQPVLYCVSTAQEIQKTPQYSSSNDVPLVSVRGVDYTILRDFLATGEWKEADEETGRCMLKAARRESEGWLTVENIDHFPCEDLQTIDQLWVKYSHGKFGFSLQKQIYESLGGTRDYNDEILETFGNQVGWRNGVKWLCYSELTFSLDTFTGHLPSPRGTLTTKIEEDGTSLAYKGYNSLEWKRKDKKGRDEYEWVVNSLGVEKWGERFSSLVTQRLLDCNI